MKDGPSTRAAILAAVKQHKGLHKSQLCRTVRIGWGNLGHHVRILADKGSIVLERHGRLLWVFDPSTERHERDFAVALRSTPARRLLEALGLRERATIRGLSQELELSKKVIRTHLGALTRVGAVAQVEGHPPTYAVRSNHGRR